MTLTPENKATIDAKDVEELLRHVRFAKAGDMWFSGETGEYWMKRLNELRDKNPAAYVTASKRIGWD